VTATAAAPAAGGPRAARNEKIGLLPVLAFAVGAMVGGGVFTLSGTAIDQAGPAALISYLLAGLIMFVSALAFVAVAARAKDGDSGYGPVAELLGRPWRFLVMWGFYLNALLAVAFLADSFGNYLHAYFLTTVSATVAGIVCIGLLVMLNLGPAVWVGRAETWIVGIKIGLLLVFIGWGLAAITGAHFTPFNPHGASTIFPTSALLFTAYTGFNVVTNMAPSVRDPARTVPRAVIGAVAISGAVYMLVVVAMLDSGIRHFGPAGVSQAATALMGHWGGQLIAFAACLSTLSGANAMLLGGSEIALRLVVQEDVPAFIGKTTKGGFPWMSVGLVGVIALMLVLFSNILSVIVIGNIVALFAMFIMNMAAVVLARRGFPGTGFRIPGGPVIPVVAGAACVWQFSSYGLADLLAGAIAMLLGLALYAMRDVRRNLYTEVTLFSLREAIRQLETPLARALRNTFRPWPFHRHVPLPDRSH
jgi:APA family basic amino acid/polyamine antiporter